MLLNRVCTSRYGTKNNVCNRACTRLAHTTATRQNSVDTHIICDSDPRNLVVLHSHCICSPSTISTPRAAYTTTSHCLASLPLMPWCVARIKAAKHARRAQISHHCTRFSAAGSGDASHACRSEPTYLSATQRQRQWPHGRTPTAKAAKWWLQAAVVAPGTSAYRHE